MSIRLLIHSYLIFIMLKYAIAHLQHRFNSIHSILSVTNDTQETEKTTDMNWDSDRILRPWLWFQAAVRPASSRGRPRRVCMCTLNLR